jgi:hypothetical protein
VILAAAILQLISLHAPGRQLIIINPEAIVSMRTPREHKPSIRLARANGWRWSYWYAQGNGAAMLCEWAASMFAIARSMFDNRKQVRRSQSQFIQTYRPRLTLCRVKTGI